MAQVEIDNITVEETRRFIEFMPQSFIFKSSTR